MRSMTDQTSGKHLELNDDGTARRKYDLENLADGKMIVRGTIAFVVASAFVMLKNILFGAPSAEAAPVSGASSKAGQVAEAEDQITGEQQTLQQDRTVDDEQPTAPGSGSRIDMNGSAVSVEPELVPLRYATGGGRITSSNDNEQLYGAAPGRAIGLNADSIDVPRQSSGQGGSGGGAAGEGTSGGGPGQNPDNDEDDDDDGQTPGSGGGGTTNPETPRSTNRVPLLLGPVLLAALLADEARAISPTDLLAFASDPDGDTLQVRNLTASSGTIQQRPDGTWMFTPEPGDTSGVTFTYLVSDGKDSVRQTATLDLVPRPTPPGPGTGTPGTGNSGSGTGPSIIDGTSGDDVIIGSAGNDVIYGRDGNDRIVAGDGNDVVYAGKGNDVVFAGDGDDIVSGGEGDDTLFGEKGNDVLLGDEGNDTLSGGDDNDTLIGGAGDDDLLGDAGDDVLDGGTGDDKVDGGDGNDTAIGGEGNDTATLGAGDDTAVATPDDGDDDYDGGTGRDTYNTSGSSANIVTDLTQGTSTSSETGTDRVVNFEDVVSGSGDDDITGTDGANTVTAGAGDDTANTGGGDDTIIATVDDGDDTYDGGAGSDTYDTSATSADADIDMSAGTANSSEIGDDTITSVENVVSGAGDDTITGSDAGNVVDSGAGDDTVSLGAGDDTVIASVGDGDDCYDGGDGEDTYDISSTSADALIDLIAQSATSLEIGRDLISSFENINAGHGNDIVIASNVRNVIIGGGGDDTFVFQSSAAIGYGSGRDKIMDFSVGDRIDIDRVRDEFADDLSDSFKDQDIERFVLIGQQDTFAQPGEMKLRYETFNGETITILSGNIDYDSDAEFELEFAGTYQLTNDDFYRST